MLCGKGVSVLKRVILPVVAVFLVLLAVGQLSLPEASAAQPQTLTVPLSVSPAGDDGGTHWFLFVSLVLITYKIANVKLQVSGYTIPVCPPVIPVGPQDGCPHVPVTLIQYLTLTFAAPSRTVVIDLGTLFGFNLNLSVTGYSIFARGSITINPPGPIHTVIVNLRVY
jgi:hypothetical protein